MLNISIVVPVYNVEKYLDKCLKSLVNQTLKNIEIIVVNDGSTDNSQKIIDKYQKKYPKLIKSYFKKNGGLSDARNYGLKKAVGEYIGFVDSDDWIEPDMMEKMYYKAKEKDFDIVICNVKYIYETKEKIVKSGLKEDLVNKEQIKENINRIYPIVPNKIFHKRLINIYFKEKVWFEDVEFLFRLYPTVKSIGVIHKPFYNYLQRSNSITYSFNEKLYDIINNFNSIIDYYKESGFYEDYYSELEYAYIRYSFGTFPRRLSKSKNKKIYNKGINFAIKQVKEKFPNYKNNKYITSNNDNFYKKIFNNVYLKYYNKFFSRIMFIMDKNRKN